MMGILKIVIKIAQNSAEVMGVCTKIIIKDCQSSAEMIQNSIEVIASFKDCHQRLPTMLLKRWLSLKIVIKAVFTKIASKTAQSFGVTEEMRRIMKIVNHTHVDRFF